MLERSVLCVGNFPRRTPTSEAPRHSGNVPRSLRRQQSKPYWLVVNFRGGEKRQNYFEGGAFSGLALDFNPSAVILDDAFADRQSQTEAGFLVGGVKRLKNFLRLVLCHAAAGIRN